MASGGSQGELMQVSLSAAAPAQVSTDILVLPTRTEWTAGEVQRLDAGVRGALSSEARRQRFQGGEGNLAVFQTHGALPCRYVLLAGVGDASEPRAWYALAQATIAQAEALSATRAAIALAGEAASTAVLETIAEGLRLSSYRFERLKNASVKPRPALRHVTLLVSQPTAALRSALRHADVMAAATCYARDLINLPAAIVTPAYLADEARRIARAHGLRARLLDVAGIKRLRLGALLGVAQGSAQPPRFIELVYRPRRARTCVALVGKGITFDSGGLSIKTADAMQTQKRDMAGGAVVLAVMGALRDLRLPVEVRGYVPATENMPGGRAIKPGDVVRAYNGKTIEVLNTDAEGRLVLADALSYAAAAVPNVLIDLATLTAAVRTALGHRYAAIMGTDAALVQSLIAGGRACGEHLWELPLVAEYRPEIDSAVADLKNVGEGSSAGTIIGGLFLREFAGRVPWAHIDFSSTVMTDKPFAGHPRGASGFGVRTLLRYLRAL